MTKEILKLVSTFLKLDKITNYLTSSDSTQPDEEVSAQLNQLLIFTNYVVSEIAKDYFPLYNKETITSDQDGRIYFNRLTKKAIRIKDVKNFLDLSCFFEIYPEYLKVDNANTEYKIFYSYIPKKLNSINDEIELPFGVDYFVVCFGVASEFASANGLYEEAQMWEDKFVSELKSIRSKTGERRFFARRLK